MEIINPKRHKYYMIYDWKRKGVITEDFDEVYDIYINTMECDHCGKEFPDTTDRCLDHDHETGNIRAIVCKKCNCYDNYLRYPLGFNEQDDKQRRKKWREDNIDKIRITRKKYEQENAEKISIRKKAQYQKNKERLIQKRLDNKEIINEKKREKCTCECGVIYTKASKARHERSKKHICLMEQLD